MGYFERHTQLKFGYYSCIIYFSAIRGFLYSFGGCRLHV